MESHFRILHSGRAVNHMHSLTPLHILQKRAIRIVAKAPYNSHHIPLCYSLEILDLEHLYSVRALSFFNDYFHGNLPPFFLNKFNLYFSRNNVLFIKTNYRRTDIASCSIFHTLTNIWNPLPSELKIEISKSKKTFINKIKMHFIAEYKNWKCETPHCFVCIKHQ